jgi:pimeloyl-ACP methyl ester carboxylesterase
VAWHAAGRRQARGAQTRPVDRVIMLAPALDFAADSRLDPIVDNWRREGRREVFHYGYGRPMDIGFALYEDAQDYDSHRVNVDVPVLVFQGRADQVVSASSVAAFAASRPNVRLRLLDDDHQLQAHLQEIWQESAVFLGLGEP